MRILLIQDFLRVGGTEHHALSIATGLQRLGHRVGLVTFRPGGALPPPALEGGMGFHCLQPFDSRIDIWAPGLMRMVRKLNPDAILLMGRSANCHGRRLKRAFPKVRMAGSFRTGRRLPAAYRRSLEAVDVVVANSRWARERLRESGLRIRELRLVPNALLRAVDWDEAGRIRMEVRTRMGIASGNVVVVYVAAFLPGKNHAGLLELMGGLDERVVGDWSLWLLGCGPLEKAIRQSARQLGIAHRLNFLGYQSDPMPWLLAADVAVSTSREESLPNALMEAQAAGLPVVAEAVSGVEETFLPGRSGFLVSPGCENEFLEKLTLLLKEEELRQEMSREARAYARGFPSTQDEARSYAEILSVPGGADGAQR